MLLPIFSLFLVVLIWIIIWIPEYTHTEVNTFHQFKYSQTPQENLNSPQGTNSNRFMGNQTKFHTISKSTPHFIQFKQRSPKCKFKHTILQIIHHVNTQNGPTYLTLINHFNALIQT